jgi:hypothetical protein
MSQLNVMDDNEQSPEVQSPSQQIIGVASFACMVALTFFYWYAGPAVKALDLWWAKLLVYALIPILVTFIILYRSGWHQEIAGPIRTCSLLLLSCVILVGVYFVIGAMLAVGWYFLSSITPHVGGR